MFWFDPRIKTNFSHEEDANTLYDRINFRFNRLLVQGQDIRDRIQIWLPDYDFDNQLAITPVSEKFIITSLNIVRKAYGTSASAIEMGLDMKITVLCEFDFLNYPMDHQTCNLTFRNKRFLNNVFWLYKQNQVFSIRRPFRALGSNIMIEIMDGNSQIGEKTGFKIHMKRVLAPFLLQCYSPAIAIVMISSIGFIVPLSAIPGRVTLGVTLFLTLANIFYDNRVNKVILRLLC